MIPGLLTQTVDVYRRTSTGRDVLNNPTYGEPVTGAGWAKVYTGMPCRLAFGSKPIDFDKQAERVTPSGVVYYGPTYNLKAEDRIVTTDNIQYVVVSIVPAYYQGAVISHYESIVHLP